MVITENDLKENGLNLIKNAIEDEDEAIIENKYIVLDLDYYNYLKELEIQIALKETKEDMKNGNYKIMSAKEHKEDIDNEL